MTIAIALATHNGARFLREQLESLERQTRPPDQVLIRDDLSTDATLAMAEQFKRSVSFRVDILQGREQLGPMGNFLKAADACDAEYIAFCDQDDVWFPRKLEVCENAMRASGCWALVHSIEHFRDTPVGGRARIGRTLVPSRTVDGLQIPPHRVMRGMSMMIHKSLLAPSSRLKQLWEPRFDAIAKTRPLSLVDHWSHAHDMSMLTTARLLGSLTFVRDVLAGQREHDGNYSRVGSLWAQIPGMAESWGGGRNQGRLVMSAFCKDFAAMLEDEACLDVLSKERLRVAREHYLRWSTIWRTRAGLHADQVPSLVRIKKLFEIAARGGYCGAFHGGMGTRGLGKDTLAIFGLRDG